MFASLQEENLLVSLSTSLCLGSRALQGQQSTEKNSCGHSIAPISCSGGSPGCSHNGVCSVPPITCLCWGMHREHPGCRVLRGPKVLQLFWQEFLGLRLHFYWHGSFHSQRWCYFVTLFLADTAQLFYALKKI